jgi:hypothetical protein
MQEKKMCKRTQGTNEYWQKSKILEGKEGGNALANRD